MPKSKSKNEFKVVKILKSDYLKIKKWAVVREMKIYEVISYLVNK